MIFNKLISITAALAVGSMTLYAAPDNMKRGDEQRSSNQGKGNGQERSYSQQRPLNQDRSSAQQRSNTRENNPVKGEIRREEVRKTTPQKTTAQKSAPSPVKSSPSTKTGTKSTGKTALPPPFQKTVTKPGTIVRTERPKHYYRPPGARPLPYYHRPGYTIHTLPRLAVTLAIGGLLFYYADGIYYRHATSGFIVATPPVGVVITTLPVGYTVFVLGGLTYYYYADVYYVWDSYRGGYRVVEAPLDVSTYQPGEIVDILPDGATSVTINGVQYYRYNNIYFMQTVQGNRVVYVVVTPQ